MRRISFAQRFIAYLCCLSLNVPVLAQAHTIGPNGPIPVERAPLPLPAPESLPESRPVPPPITKPVNTPIPAPTHVPAESETAGKRKKEIYYIHTDHLNTPRAITNGEQKKVWKWGNVDPFGKNAADENPEGQGRFAFNLRFPGQYYDRETGLHYNWHRDYDPGVGRYVQSDPIGLEGGLTTYSYTKSNPLIYIDPRGEFIIPVYLPVFFGALTGVLGKFFSDPERYLKNPSDTWQELAIAAMLGAVSSFIPISVPSGSGFWFVLFANAVAGFNINLIDQMVSALSTGSNICIKKIFANEFLSAFAARIGNFHFNTSMHHKIIRDNSDRSGTMITSLFSSLFSGTGMDGKIVNCFGGCD